MQEQEARELRVAEEEAGVESTLEKEAHRCAARLLNVQKDDSGAVVDRDWHLVVDCASDRVDPSDGGRSVLL